MKRLTFTAVLHVSEDDYDAYSTPAQLAEQALTYGDKHQDWYFDHQVENVTVEDKADE